MGNCGGGCESEVDKEESEIMKGPYHNASQKVVDAFTQMTPDNVSIASCDIEGRPLPEQVMTTECDDNTSNASVGTTCLLVGEGGRDGREHKTELVAV